MRHPQVPKIRNCQRYFKFPGYLLQKVLNNTPIDTVVEDAGSEIKTKSMTNKMSRVKYYIITSKSTETIHYGQILLFHSLVSNEAHFIS
jgi:hypothetical protein